MKRRGFLGFLGGAVAAGPVMARQAVTGLEAMTLPSFGVGDLIGGDTPREGHTVAGDSTYNHGDWLRDRISEVTGISAEERRGRINDMTVSVLDPDIAMNRSMALWAKVAEQKRRNFERQQAHDVRYWTRELASWLKERALS